jgi:hypothetical protein
MTPHPIATQAATLTFLVPPDALPPEDAPPLARTGRNGASELFAQLNKLVRDPILAFEIRRDHIYVDALPELVLEQISLANHESSNATTIDAPSVFGWWKGSGLNWQGTAARTDDAGEEQQASVQAVQALVKQLTEHERFHEFPRLDEGGEVVPVFRWSQVRGCFVGELVAFWVRTPEDLHYLQGTEQRLANCRFVGLTADEVEGRGLRDIAAAAILLGMLSGPLAGISRAGTETAGADSHHPSQTGAHARASTSQPSSGRQAPARQEPAKFNREVLKKATPQNTRIAVSLSKQRVYLMVGDEVAIDAPISSGRAGKSTPTGHYTVSDKDKNHVSSIYHCPMRYFLRLSGLSFGLHVGELPGYPASHGCVRLPEEVARALFETASVGTSVTIEA